MLNFVQKICEGRGPLLLALSGGPDSTALYQLMLDAGHPFEVVHVDHGWRKESAEEAQKLRKKVTVPFHLRTLEKPEKNAEEWARKQRLAIYKEIMDERGLEGVLLGHHADDQAEVILKRIFEGARLTKLVGLEEEKKVEGVLLLRPLLSLRKKQLIRYLEEHSVDFFVESEADDLRSRMRREIVPLLSSHFGKEVGPALCRLADDARQLRIEKKQYWIQEGIADFFEKEGVAISKPTQKAILSHLLKRSERKEMVIGKGKAIIERGFLRYNKRIDEE